jgi:hypothetical protein
VWIAAFPLEPLVLLENASFFLGRAEKKYFAVKKL